MNERIKELAEQADNWSDEEFHRLFLANETPDRQKLFKTKFAELIVEECVHVALKDALPDWGDQASEANAQCVKIASDLKEHFGIEE